MKAIIVDDEPDGIRTLKKLMELNCPDVEIAGYLLQCDHGKTAAGGNQTRPGIPGYPHAGQKRTGHAGRNCLKRILK